jgi:excinuclease ABC subunit C
MLYVSDYNPPALPGVYIFKDQYGVFLYIGKAKNLKKRLKSYVTDKYVDWKIESLLQYAVVLDWIITKTEQEALLLEAELISLHKPTFNRLLSGDNPFIYLIVENGTKDILPQIRLSRAYQEIKKNKGFVWGPFLHKKDAQNLIDYMLTTFNLYICNKTISHGCLAYHLGKCSGSCKFDFDKEAYIERFLLARSALSKDHEVFLKIVDRAIEKSKNNFDFEEVIRLLSYRDSAVIIFSEIESKINDRYDDIDRVISETTLKEDFIKQGLEDLQLLFKLSHIPSGIDCIDISHFQGHAIVGSIIRFRDGVYSKKESRSFSLPNAVHDDYANIKKVIAMGYSNKELLPDILMIDGGKGQLHAAQEVLKNVSLCSLAKREERLYLDNGLEVVLDIKKPLGVLLISLRNITHQAAIQLHRYFFKKNRTR